MRVGFPAGGEHHRADRNGGAVDELRVEQAVPAPRQRSDIGIEPHGHAFPRHFDRQPLAQFVVEAAQQLRTAIDQRRLHAQAVEDRGELDRDIAAAHHDHRLGQAFKVERLVRSDRKVAARDVGHLGPGAGGDQDVLRAPDPAGRLDLVRAAHHCALAENRYAGVHQQPLVNPVQARDFAVLVLE